MVMKAQDLRIGNIVSCKAYLSEPTKVIAIMDSGDERGNYLRLEGVPHGVWMENKGELIVNGVPLTEGVLVKLGFNSFENEETQMMLFKKCFIELDYDIAKKVFSISYNNEGILIQHIHQLQNIYHVFTGEELNLNN